MFTEFFSGSLSLFLGVMLVANAFRMATNEGVISQRRTVNIFMAMVVGIVLLCINCGINARMDALEEVSQWLTLQQDHQQENEDRNADSRQEGEMLQLPKKNLEISI